MTEQTNGLALTPEQEKAVIETKEVLASKQDTLLKLGQIQAFNFIGKLVTVTELKTIQLIKESKSYKGLTYKNKNGDLVTVTTWDECCEKILGTNVQNIDNRLRNLEIFGDEFFEASQKMGLGYRELRKLRQLPADEQTLVIENEAVNSGDKEAIKDLIEDLHAKHNKALDVEKQKNTEAQQLLNARQKIINTNNQLLEEAQNEIEKLKAKDKYAPLEWKAMVFETNMLCSKLATAAIQALNQLAELSDRIITTSADPEFPEAAIDHMACVHVHAVDQVFVHVNALSIEVREQFSEYVDRARPMYSEAEIDALADEIDSRG